MTEHKKVCLELNAEQAVKLEKGTTEFKVCTKHIKITFVIAQKILRSHSL